MTKYTQKQLREMVSVGMATDISHIGCKEADELREKEGWLSQIGYAIGVYGCNGQLFKGHNTGRIYAITSRTQAIFLFQKGENE